MSEGTKSSSNKLYMLLVSTEESEQVWPKMLETEFPILAPPLVLTLPSSSYNIVPTN